MRIANKTTMTMITISTTVLTISSLLGSRAMSNRDVGVRSIGPLISRSSMNCFSALDNSAGGLDYRGRSPRRDKPARRREGTWNIYVRPPFSERRRCSGRPGSLPTPGRLTSLCAAISASSEVAANPHETISSGFCGERNHPVIPHHFAEARRLCLEFQDVSTNILLHSTSFNPVAGRGKGEHSGSRAGLHAWLR